MRVSEFCSDVFYSDLHYNAYTVTSSGDSNNWNVTNSYGVRPALMKGENEYPFADSRGESSAPSIKGGRFLSVGR